IARGREGRRNAREDSASVVGDPRGSPVTGRGADDARSKRRADGLVAEADSENRKLPREAPDDLERDAGLVRRARPRREHDRAHRKLLDLLRPQGVVPGDERLLAEHLEIASEVVDEA